MKRFFRIMIPVLILSACSSAPKDRTIPFEGIVNARELGGLVMQDGHSVRYGKLVRSGELSKASDADVALLKNRFGLSDVFDFRFERERSSAPDREMEGVENTWLSTLPEAFVRSFSSGRSEGASLSSSGLMDVLTKYAFVLAALGASRETIVEDFALSNVSYAPAIEALSAKITEQGGGESELSFIRSMIGVNVENFETTLDMIDTQYGSIQAYLEKALGFTAGEQEKLRQKYLK